MKRSFFIIACLLLTVIAFGQHPTPGSYETNVNVDKLVGTWKCVSGSDVVEIRLQKVRHTVGFYETDILLGTHLYIRNG